MIYQRGLSRTTLEGSWWGLGFALPPAVGRGRPLRVAGPGRGSARTETPPRPQQSRKGTCACLEALLGCRPLVRA